MPIKENDHFIEQKSRRIQTSFPIKENDNVIEGGNTGTTQSEPFILELAPKDHRH